MKPWSCKVPPPAKSSPLKAVSVAPLLRICGPAPFPWSVWPLRLRTALLGERCPWTRRFDSAAFIFALASAADMFTAAVRCGLAVRGGARISRVGRFGRSCACRYVTRPRTSRRSFCVRDIFAVRFLVFLILGETRRGAFCTHTTSFCFDAHCATAVVCVCAHVCTGGRRGVGRTYIHTLSAQALHACEQDLCIEWTYANIDNWRMSCCCVNTHSSIFTFTGQTSTRAHTIALHVGLSLHFISRPLTLNLSKLILKSQPQTL